jgi:acyl carrier protein
MMNKEEVFYKVQEVFRDIFDDENLIIQSSTNSDDIEEWDSLNHVNLVIAIEKAFKIKFNFHELATLKDVGGMIELIFKKILQ